MALHRYQQVYDRGESIDTISRTVFYLRAPFGGTIKRFDCWIGSVFESDVIFHILKNGVAVYSGAARPTITAGQTSVSKTDQSIAVTRGDKIQVDIQGGLPMPVTFGMEVDDGETSEAMAVWGDIIGSLANQTDLQTILNAKANLSGATFTGDVLFGTKAKLKNGSGRLRLGDTTDPGAMLDISSPSGTTPFQFTQNAAESSTPSLALFNTADGSLAQMAAAAGYFLLHGQSGKGLKINGGGFGSRDNGLIITSGNLFGLGKTPTEKLDVNGKIKASNVIESTSGGFKFPDGTTQTTAATEGGNGGSVGAFSPDAVPDTPNAFDDEFTEFSGWTNEVNGIGATYSVSKSRLKISKPRWGTEQHVEYIYKPAPTGDFDVVLKMSVELDSYYAQRFGMYIKTSSPNKNLLLGNSVSNTPNFETGFLKNFNARTFYVDYYYTTEQATLKAPTNESIYIWKSAWYFRCQRVGTNLYFYNSKDGHSWNLLHSSNEATLGAVTHLGIGVGNWNTVASTVVAYCDFIRNIQGDTLGNEI